MMSMNDGSQGQRNRGESGDLNEFEQAGLNLRKVHYMLHNIDTVIGKIESRGASAPITSKEFKMMLKLMYEVRQINLKEIKAM